jgi:mRNA-degrading endonuclease RelE of RelBE toxin-antitoxin system
VSGREQIQTITGYFDLVRLPEYNRQLDRLSKREPDLHALVVGELRILLDSKTIKPIPGLGGWAKARIPAPTMKIGKSGAFRAIFLFLHLRGKVYLATVYFKREKTDLTPIEKKALAQMAAEFKE